MVQGGRQSELLSLPTSKELLRVALHKGHYWLYNPGSVQEVREPLFVVLREYVSENGQPGMRFRQGDVVKLGRCSFLVREVVGESKDAALEAKEELKLTQNDIDIEVNEDLNEIKPEMVLDNKAQDGILDSSKSSEGNAESIEKESGQSLSASSNEIKCRICLGDDSTKENPMISSPCKCLGTIKYIHANCLQHWLKSKVSEHKNSFCYSYCWKEFECDVCKTKYPGNWYKTLDTITYPDGSCMQILFIHKPKDHYLTLEQINGDRSHKIYIIFLDKQGVLKIVRVERR